MSVIELSQNPQEIIEVVLGAWSENPIPPGFCHVFSAISCIIAYCQLKNLYPVINDDNWYYGSWNEFFIPFWDESHLDRVLNSGLPKRVVDTNLDSTYQGFLFNSEPGIQEPWLDVYRKIYQLHPSMVDIIHTKTKEIPPIDLALQLRLGYEHGCAGLDAAYQNIVRRMAEQSLTPNNIFVMTDTYAAIPYLMEKFPDKRIHTLCPNEYDGIAVNIRNRENLITLLSELEVTRKAKHFIGAPYSAITHFVQILNNEWPCCW